MDFFVPKGSIVRKIWGKSDTILFIFAGAAAEFALNKAVDWLYFTGRLPADPLGRLFSTVSYARQIVFAPKEQAEEAIDKITAIHKKVEAARETTIPAWAYRDVLFLLIHYSIAAFELLERKLSHQEKEELYEVFFKIGQRMGLKKLPASFKEWLPARQQHLEADLCKSAFTTDLYQQYHKHLGSFRFYILKEVQQMVVPRHVALLLGFRSFSFVSMGIPLYKWSRFIGLDRLIKAMLLPSFYKTQIRALDVSAD